MKKIALTVLSVVAATIAVLKIWLLIGPFADFSPPQADAGSRTTIAFVGDHGARPESFGVFELIRREGADLLVSPGDFGYDKFAGEFETVLDATLGPDFPIIAALGNHDRKEQLQYRAFFRERLANTPEVVCDGDILIRSACSYRGIDIVSTTPGVSVLSWLDDGSTFLERTLASSRSRWKICNWHKNQSALQLGGKGNSVGWDSYEICRKHGALIVTAHEHSYGRTFPITRMSEAPAYDPADPAVARLFPGQTTVIVSGLGGQSVREQLRDDPWWAAKYTSDQGAKEGGVLFCTFEKGGLSDEAQCRFVDSDGKTIDRFRLEADGPRRS